MRFYKISEQDKMKLEGLLGQAIYPNMKLADVNKTAILLINAEEIKLSVKPVVDKEIPAKKK